MNKERTKKMLKKVWCFFPEICITFAILIFIHTVITTVIENSSSTTGYITLGVLIVALLVNIGQFYWRNVTISLIYSTIFGLGSLYMTLAVISEYNEFPAGDPKAIQLLLVGLFIFGGFAFISFIMPWKYIRFLPSKPNF